MGILLFPENRPSFCYSRRMASHLGAAYGMVGDVVVAVAVVAAAAVTTVQPSLIDLGQNQ